VIGIYNIILFSVSDGLPSIDKQLVHSIFDNTLLWSVSHVRINVLEHLLGLTTLRTSLFRSLYSILLRVPFLSVSKALNFHSEARLSNVIGSNSERLPVINIYICVNIDKHLKLYYYLLIIITRYIVYKYFFNKTINLSI